MNKFVRNNHFIDFINPNFFCIKGNNDESYKMILIIFKILIFYTITSIPLLIVLSIHYIHLKICIYAESQGAQKQYSSSSKKQQQQQQQEAAAARSSSSSSKKQQEAAAASHRSKQQQAAAAKLI